MTLASMSSPEFVEPAVIKNDVYISGDNVAKSPALFAYMFTKKRVQDHNIRVIRIGTINEEPMSSELNQYSLIDWFSYLMKNNHNWVQHTMDYMLESITEQNNHEYYKFELKRDAQWMNQLSLSHNKTAHAYEAAEIIINSQRQELDNVLNQLIYEKFGPVNSCFTD